MHSPKPAKTPAEARSRKMSRPNRTTQIGAVVAKNVALAMLVLKIDRCQKNKSPATASAAKMVARENDALARPSPRSLIFIQA